jgi:hypothetical protein
MLLLLIILLVGIVLTVLEELVSALLLIVLLLDAMDSDNVALMVEVTGSCSGCAAKVSDCTDSVSDGEVSNQLLSSADIYGY